MRRLILGCVALVLLWCAAPAQAKSTQTGYLTMADGVQLKYTVVLPDGKGPFPVALTFDGYDSGVTGSSEVVLNAATLNAHGYAALGVNVRGTGCSQGVFQMFPRQWGPDGAAVIEWAARQPWSTGKIAEVGHSFAGFASWGVAAQHPPHLAAIAVAVTAGDFYRDAVYPGGIYNLLLADAFLVGQEGNAIQGVEQATAEGDLKCAANFAVHTPQDISNTTAVATLAHPYDDDYWHANARDQYFGQVDVPVLASNTWQDSIAGSGIFGHELTQVKHPDKLWFIGGNGDHDLFDPTPDTLFAFLDHYTKGTANGWEQQPHIQLWQDDALPSKNANRVRPGWQVHLPSFPLPVQSHELFLKPGHALSDAAPTAANAPDNYAYPRVSGNALTVNNGLDQTAWTLPIDTSGAQVYTTAPLDHDVVLAGPASLDLWLSSTAATTDVQATLTELRPDGKEVYLQRGWLRMSMRQLDTTRTTDLEPVITGAQSDVKPLVPGQPTLGRLRIFPFSHALRRGSRLRVTIDAPDAPTGVHGFAFDATPSTDTVYHDATHQSVLRLGVLAGQKAAKPLPACGVAVGEPCRTDPFAKLPMGTEPVFVGTDRPILPANACVSRRRIVIHLPKRAVSARVTVSGRRAKTYRGRHLKATIDLRGLPRGRYQVAIVIRTASKQTIRSTRSYRTCSAP